MISDFSCREHSDFETVRRTFVEAQNGECFVVTSKLISSEPEYETTAFRAKNERRPCGCYEVVEDSAIEHVTTNHRYDCMEAHNQMTRELERRSPRKECFPLECPKHRNPNVIKQDLVVDHETKQGFFISSIRLEEPVLGELDFETMVFRAECERLPCGCPKVKEWIEIECRRATNLNDILTAHNGIIERYLR